MHLSEESMAPAIINNLKQKAGVASPHWRRSDALSASPKSGQLLPISIRGFRVVIQPKNFSICIFHHDVTAAEPDIDAARSECFLLLQGPVWLQTGLIRELLGLYLMIYPTVSTGRESSDRILSR